MRRNPGHVGGDLLVAEELAQFLLARGIADAAGAAAEQHHRPMPVSLQQAQHHDLHERADMQRIRRAVEPDIAGKAAFQQGDVEPFGIGALEREAALGGLAQEIAFRHVGGPR